MMVKKRGLGRGLDALLNAGSGRSKTDAPAEPSSDLPVDLIRRGRFQPRRHFDADRLQELADSIRAQGVVQPIVVRPVGTDRYELIAGERRWRAAQLAGLADIPVVIREVDDQTAMAMALIENIQRDDLNPLEEAEALHRLLAEFELTHQQIGEAIGKSRTTVTNLVRLLDLNTDVKEMIDAGQLEMGHARALLALQGEQQSRIAEQVARKGLSVRETEALVRKLRSGAAPARSATEETDPDVRRLIQDLGDRLGARVDLKQSSGGSGKLLISYNSLEELQGIIEHIK